MHDQTTPSATLNNYRSQISQILSIFLTIITFQWLVQYLYGKYNKTSDVLLSLYQSSQEFVLADFQDLRGSFCPEPAERLAYLWSLIFIPVGLLIFYILSLNILKRIRHKTWLVWIYQITLVVALSCAALLVIQNIAPVKELKFFYAPLVHIPIFIVSTVAIFFLANYLQKHGVIKNIIEWFLGLFCIATIVAVAAYNVYDERFEFIASGHFIVAFSGIANVYLNHIPQLTQPSTLYGSYGYFLEPVFRIIGLSVLKYTVVMAFLLGFTFLSLLFFLWRFIHNKLIAFFCFLGLIVVNYFHYPQQYEPYFQYFPIRTLFPALSIFFVWKYLSTKKRVFYFVSLFLCSVGIFWNLETGIICFVSWLAVLCYDSLLSQKKSQTAQPILSHLLTNLLEFGIVAGLFMIYIRWRLGAWPDFSRVLIAPSLFYKFGWYLLPMPLHGLWRLVVLIYLLGLSYSLRFLFYKNGDFAKAKMILFLSILGAGLFSYYQGRSHIDCLLIASYPAMLLLAIAADALTASLTLPLLRANKFEFLWRSIVFAIFIFFLSYPASALVVSSTRNMLLNRLQTITCPMLVKGGQSNPELEAQTNFIRQCLRQYGKPNDKIILITPYELLLYLKLGIRSPWAGPGIHEMFLRKDYEEYKKFLTDCNDCKVFVSAYKTYAHQKAFFDPAIRKLYRPIYISNDERFIFFDRKR